MDEFKLCKDGEFMPVKLPCPTPYSGPYYYYPSDNIPFPPPSAEGSFDDFESSGGGGGAPISAGAVAGIIILMGLIIVMLCLFAIKFRTRLFGRRSIWSLSGTRYARNRDAESAGDFGSANSGDAQFLSTVVGGGLEEKLVNLLPVYEYVRFQDEGKELLKAEQKVEDGNSCTECAVCLSLFEEKDIVRILPKCKHVFHLLCIDKWFESHANCPLCREKITLQTIRLFLEYSEDHIAAGDLDGSQLQLMDISACQNEANHPENRGGDDDRPARLHDVRIAVDNCEDQHRPQRYSMPQNNNQTPHQGTEHLAICTPHDNPVLGLQLASAAGNDQGPQTGYHNATMHNQIDLAVDQKLHDLSDILNASALQKPYDDGSDKQAFSFPVAATDHAIVERGDKELSSVAMHAASDEAAIRSGVAHESSIELRRSAFRSRSSSSSSSSSSSYLHEITLTTKAELVCR
ncbi:hypothetical protein L7F22_022381 [Adiantum nelumboides]|nr:hypothetical protein [Adiantum nelumboides]MCO5568682.1 hypothetical protein [Adiantum nelumboides]